MEGKSLDLSSSIFNNKVHHLCIAISVLTPFLLFISPFSSTAIQFQGGPFNHPNKQCQLVPHWTAWTWQQFFPRVPNASQSQHVSETKAKLSNTTFHNDQSVDCELWLILVNYSLEKHWHHLCSVTDLLRLTHASLINIFGLCNNYSSSLFYNIWWITRNLSVQLGIYQRNCASTMKRFRFSCFLALSMNWVEWHLHLNVQRYKATNIHQSQIKFSFTLQSYLYSSTNTTDKPQHNSAT